MNIIYQNTNKRKESVTTLKKVNKIKKDESQKNNNFKSRAQSIATDQKMTATSRNFK
jgi:hypothetical protein